MTVTIQPMSVVIFILIIILTFLAGFTLRDNVAPTTGEVIIDTSDPEKDRWLFKIDVPPEWAAKQHIMKLKVVHRQLKEDERWPEEK